MNSQSLLDRSKGRFFAFGILYISEGILVGFTSTAMVAFMRREGLSLEQIGTFVALLYLPWTFKWVWAPLIDIVKLQRFGGRRTWILFCTAMMIGTLLITAMVDYVVNFQLLLIMIVINNFFGATQDVAIDSLAVSPLKADERGTGNGFMFSGQFLGIALGGGGAIFVSGLWGFNVSIIYICSLMLLCFLFVLFFIRDPDISAKAGESGTEIVSKLVDTLAGFMRELYTGFLQSGSGPKIGLLFAVMPMGAMALAYAILGTMEVDYGLSNNQIATLSVYNTVLSGLGCLAGGLLGDKLGLKKILAMCYVLTAFPTLYLAAQISINGLEAVSLVSFYAAILLHGLFFGMGTGLNAAVFMGMTNPLVAATQFTAFMAMSNLAISMANYWQGRVAEAIDYAAVLYLDSLLVVLPLLLIPFLKNREEHGVKETMMPAAARID
tara:strand:- start:893 stop:2206 length:1314 start_codon:yes stop_codon:yes gene_type:complete